MKQEKSKKKGIIIVGVSVILLSAILGVSFAIWNYSRVGDNQILVAGDVYMKFKETPALTIENAIPSEGPGENDYFEFTIEGKNTYSKPIWYEIDLQYGEDHGTRKTRIKDSLLKFRLVEIKDGNEETVVDNASYNNLTNKKIWVNTIAANTKTKVEITYRLYMWISSDTIIGNTSDAVYDMETWNNDIFASIKVNVAGDFNEKELEEDDKITLVDEVKSKLVKYEESSKESFYGGLVAINTDGTLYNETNNETIREYRYSGNTVNNYVKFNNELWRIIGVFKEDEEEYVKIVKKDNLTGDYFPDKYIINGTEYSIRSFTKNNDDKNFGDGAFWNYLEITDDEYHNGPSDWTTAGLQFYLNTEHDDNSQNKGYLNYISEDSKKMLIETTYYLGNVYIYSEYIGGGTFVQDRDTTLSAYIHERGNIECDSSVTSNSYTNNNCNIWYGNKATWKGLVGLMYLSDLGFSGISNNWNKNLAGGWIEDLNPSQEVEKAISLAISPSSIEKKIVADIDFYSTAGRLFLTYTADEDEYDNTIRPVLTLSSKVKVTSGNGTETQPYLLSM